MKNTLANKTVVLTGASGGIGEAIAGRLASEGATLVLVARNQERLDQLCSQLGGAPHTTVAVDLSTTQGRRKLVDSCRKMDKGVDVLINNAGINSFTMFEDHSQEHIEQMLQVNLLSPMFVCQDLLPVLTTGPSPHIINIGSTFGAIGYPGFSVYCASKFGLRGFTEALRRELSDGSVEVSYIAPRATRTAINSDQVVEMNKELGTAMDDPKKVASEVLQAIRRPARSDKYIGWPEKLFVRINALLPGIVDKSLRKQLPVIRKFARG